MNIEKNTDSTTLRRNHMSRWFFMKFSRVERSRLIFRSVHPAFIEFIKGFTIGFSIPIDFNHHHCIGPIIKLSGIVFLRDVGLTVRWRVRCQGKIEEDMPNEDAKNRGRQCRTPKQINGTSLLQSVYRVLRWVPDACLEEVSPPLNDAPRLVQPCTSCLATASSFVLEPNNEIEALRRCCMNTQSDDWSRNLLRVERP